MKINTLGHVLSLLLLFTGCSTTFKPWTLSQLSPGMTTEQVTQKLGAPHHISQKDGSVIYHYTYTEPIPLQNEIVMQREDSVLPMRTEPHVEINTYHYEVVLVDGKLMNYKERY